MSLDPGYLDYPHRREGYDHGLYAWSALKDRPPIAWPDGKSIAVWFCVGLEWFPITPADTPFRAPGHMVTPYPDYRHYTSRDYGNRVGVYRFLDAFENAGVRASFATNAAIARRYPALVADIAAASHEIVAHSTDMNGTIATGLPERDEQALIARTLEGFAAAGVRPRGWLSIARSQSWNTARLLREAGLAYMCDWVNDELPYRFANGIVNLPLNHELSDRQIVATQQQSADSWAEQLRDAFDWLVAEAAATGGGRMLPIHVTPYIMGLPYRIGAFEALVTHLAARPEAWLATGGDVVDVWTAQS